MKNRKQRKLQFIQLKNNLKGSLFYTYDVLGEHTQWADIYFFGKNKCIYNATIYTTKCHWHDLLKDKAWVELRTLTKDKELFKYEDGYIQDIQLDELEGKNSSEFLEEKKLEIAKNNPPQAFANFTLLPNFKYGVGLDMVVDVDFLSVENINQAIKDFITQGETNWKSTEGKTFNYQENASFTINSISLD